MARRAHPYDAVIAAPFGRLGVRVADGRVVNVDFVNAQVALKTPGDAFARRVCRALAVYFRDPMHTMRIPVKMSGTEHQRRVWRALMRIPVGTAKSYGELARRLGSSARAIGGACRRNPIPVIVPCHRVVAQSGVGGFMGKRSGSALRIKRWLLAHERRE